MHACISSTTAELQSLHPGTPQCKSLQLQASKVTTATVQLVTCFVYTSDVAKQANVNNVSVSIHSPGAKSHLIKCGSYTQTLRPLVGKTMQACTVSDRWLAISRA